LQEWTLGDHVDRLFYRLSNVMVCSFVESNVSNVMVRSFARARERHADHSHSRRIKHARVDKLTIRVCWTCVQVSGPYHKFFVIVIATSLLIFMGGCLLRGVGASESWMGALFKSYALLSAAPGADR
jgi:hypothetical protein